MTGCLLSMICPLKRWLKIKEHVLRAKNSILKPISPKIIARTPQTLSKSPNNPKNPKTQ